MATAWVRSLSCKSSAVADDVYCPPPPPPPPPPPNKHPPLLPVSCADNDALAFLPAKGRSRFRERERSASTKPARPRPRPRKKPRPAQFMASPAAAPARASSAFLTMTELPEGHSSRRVVELIFASGWAADAAAPAPEVEALFRVHSTARAVARFEDARAAARARAAHARCAADGNEMMRFQCRAADADVVICAAVATCRAGPAESAVRTFACSGAAHANAGGGAGRRAMLVCRVIAGRVLPPNERTCHASEYGSVDMGSGELVVLDSGAVLPCFLIIYKVKAPLESCSGCHPR